MSDERINQLSMYEQNIQQLLIQRQTFHSQLAEVESALAELGKTTQAYKIIGNIMVLAEKDSVSKELADKKEMLKLRIATLEKQEKSIRDKAQSLQKEIVENMQK
ncbi:prefoldin subunit beta [Candidatus Woesearchaeota archaeon]|nr:prefoldin subunit beta [Candidatus Woesearchaeota archaeon]